MRASVYKLRCLTNMHVGSGDINFNVTDNEVERDPVTDYPTINSSGVKGSLREFCEISVKDKVKDEDKKELQELIQVAFGSEREKSGKDQKTSTPGNIKFLSANMLAIPMRSSDNSNPYYMVTTKIALESYKDLLESLNIKVDFDLSNVEDEKSYKSLALEKQNIEIEGIKVNANIKKEDKLHKFLEEHLKEKYCILSNKDFKKLSLPVMSRNRLDEEGKSENLWYEEIVPHESLFYFVSLCYNNEFDIYLEMLNDEINDKVIQFGGNASIGYGFSKVTCIGGDLYGQK